MLGRRVLQIVATTLLVAGCIFPPPPQLAEPTAEWWLDPASLPIAEDATTLEGLVREIACAGGRAPEGRVLGPRVEYLPDGIVITFAIRPLEGPQRCPSNPPFPVRIELTEPVDGRAIFDGAATRPRDATIPAE